MPVVNQPSAIGNQQSIIVVGAGIFGATAAIALRKRGHQVALFDPGPLPHPWAESTDISKVIRMEYGPDEEYMALVERAMEGWREWNAAWERPLYHELGLLLLCSSPMAPGGFEYESYHLLIKRGHRPERVYPDEIRRRFPAWNADKYVDGFFHARAAFAESGKVVAQLIREAQRMGVQLREGKKFARLIENGSKVGGIVTAGGESHQADRVVVCAGTWTGKILPHLAEDLRTVGQPVFHLKPQDPTPYQASRFPIFTGDVTTTGYYGLPVTPDGIVKVANHGPGIVMDPDDPNRTASPEQEAQLRDFLHDSIPGLAGAPIVFTRLCLYCDTWDGHLWIDRDPARQGLVVATGGSGHAFKFAPLLGDVIADTVEDRPGPLRDKFRWRPEKRPRVGEEAVRFHGQPH